MGKRTLETIWTLSEKLLERVMRHTWVPWEAELEKYRGVSEGVSWGGDDGGGGGGMQSDMAASNGVRQRRFAHLIRTALRNDRTGRRYAISPGEGRAWPHFNWKESRRERERDSRRFFFHVTFDGGLVQLQFELSGLVGMCILRVIGCVWSRVGSY